MTVTVEVKGLRELDEALGELGKAVAKRVLERALMKGAAPMVETAKRLAPVNLGRLRDSIKATTRKPIGHQTKAIYAGALRAGLGKARAAQLQRQYNRENDLTFAEVFVAPAQLAQAWPQEIGTAHSPPRPYIRPAFEQHKEQALDIIVAEIRPEITKAAERARRRALKRAR